MDHPLADTFATIRSRNSLIERELSDPATARSRQKMTELGREHSDLAAKLELIDRIESISVQLESNAQLAETDEDPEIRELALAENAELEVARSQISDQLALLLAPRDPMDERDVIVEIRAGTGGEEASLFAGQLLRMYQRFAERRGLGFEEMGINLSQSGGVKEAIVAVRGKGAFRQLKFERGVHRVQRVPVTESSGRIHTSAASSRGPARGRGDRGRDRPRGAANRRIPLFWTWWSIGKYHRLGGPHHPPAHRDNGFDAG